jgi:hypothetical protein
VSNVEHDHDDEGNCILPEEENPLYPNGLPTWRFSPWDIAGVLVITVGGLFTVIGQGSQLLAREFNAAANYARANAEYQEAKEAYEAHQRAMADDLRKIVGDPS